MPSSGLRCRARIGWFPALFVCFLLLGERGHALGHGPEKADGRAQQSDEPVEPHVQEALLQKTEEVRACYQGNIVSTRYALAVQLTLDAGGRVVDVRVRTHGRFIPASREACVVRTLRGLKLPPTERRRFTYTFKWGADSFPL